MLIEQAVFSSARTPRADGYQIIASSPGVLSDEVRALSQCCPSHDSLCENAAESVAYFALPNGARCVALTSATGEEHSLRRGPCITTRCLIVRSGELERFAYNPFALLMAAHASGRIDDQPKVDAALEGFRLAGRASALDTASLDAADSDDRDQLVAGALDALIAEKNVVVVEARNPAKFVAAIFNLLPVLVRRELTFSTALRRSPKRPFRLVVLDSSPAEERRRIEREGGVVIDSRRPASDTTASWGQLVTASWRDRRFDQVTELLSECESIASLHELRAFTETSSRFAGEGVTSPREAKQLAGQYQFRGDGSHRREQESLPQSASPVLESDPSDLLGADRPDAVAALQTLDDVVFEAIAGRAGALEELRDLWPVALSQLGATLMERCREQYLRHAIKLWRDCSDGEGSDQARLAVSATEVIELLSRDMPSGNA